MDHHVLTGDVFGEDVLKVLPHIVERSGRERSPERRGVGRRYLVQACYIVSAL